MGPVVCWSCCLVDAVRVEDVDGAPAGRLRVAAAQASAGETSTKWSEIGVVERSGLVLNLAAADIRDATSSDSFGRDPPREPISSRTPELRISTSRRAG